MFIKVTSGQFMEELQYLYKLYSDDFGLFWCFQTIFTYLGLRFFLQSIVKNLENQTVINIYSL